MNLLSSLYTPLFVVAQSSKGELYFGGPRVRGLTRLSKSLSASVSISSPVFFIDSDASSGPHAGPFAYPYAFARTFAI
jgi:hypothetical protein